MKNMYTLEKDENGTIKFWTNDKQLQEEVESFLEMIADALSYRSMIERIQTVDQRKRAYNAPEGF